MLIGIGAIGLAVIVAVPMFQGDGAATVGSGQAAGMGASLYAGVGIGLIVLGIGSIRLRRWVPPVMRTVAWTWLLTGIVALVLTAMLLDDLLAIASSQIEQDIEQAADLARKFVLLIVAAFGVVVPGILAWGYHGADVRATVRRHDTRPSWTDRCPERILPLAIGWFLLAVVSIPTLGRPAVPWFGRYLATNAGRGVTLAGIVVAVALAVLCYRQKPLGWWGSQLTLLLAGVSTLWTIVARPVSEMYKALGYPESVIPILSGSHATTQGLAVATVALTVAGVGYLWWIRKAFRPHSDVSPVLHQ